jgi:sugar phosphate isomerase/epimerase
MAKTLGAKCITASGTITVARRVDPLAQKHKMRVGWHNHSNMTPNEYARPEDFAEAQRGKSSFMAINLDIGHFTAAGYDAVDFLAKNAGQIVTLHIKDRKRNQGANTPFGQGDTPIKEVLRLLRDRKLSIPANIEYEYDGADAVEEVKKCVAYCKSALEG